MFGLDCSGVVCELLQSLGMVKNREEWNAQMLYNGFKKNSATASAPVFGSLCFYGRDLNAVTHVSFGLNSTQIIEAGGGTAATLNMHVAEDMNAYVKIRPYKHRKDFLTILNPNYEWGS